MLFLHYISGPLIGAVVGYVTNYIAIKMLFRPIKPVMLGRFRVPFTPGIVPKRKDDLAEILGRAIVNKFFNADDLEIIFKSESMAGAFADCAVALLTDKSTRLIDIRRSIDKCDDHLYKRLRDELCIRIQASMLRTDLPALLADEVNKAIENRLGNTRFRKVVNEELLPYMKGAISGKFEKFILGESRAVILSIIDDEFNELGTIPTADISAALFPDITVLNMLARNMHHAFMVKYVRPIVESIDVGGMITEKVKQMSPVEVEGLVLDVVKRELNYVVLLGALLGMIIGAINIFI